MREETPVNKNARYRELMETAARAEKGELELSEEERKRVRQEAQKLAKEIDQKDQERIYREVREEFEIEREDL